MQLTERQRELRRQIDIVAFYGIHAVEYFNGVTNAGGNFWAFTQNCYGERAVHLWCQLFNSYNKEPTHYRNLFGADALAPLDPAFRFEYIKKRLIASTGLKEEDDYLAFRKTVIDFRNKYAAHREFDMGKITFPELDYALSMFYEIRDVVRETVKAELKCVDDWDLEDYLHYCETTSRADLRRRCQHDLEKIQYLE